MQRFFRSMRRLGGSIGLLLGASSPSAEPMDLLDPSPRPVAVRFEVSSGAGEGRSDAVYGAPIVAWLSPGAEPWQRVLTIPGHAVETRLLAQHAPVPASFSDFVWSFDAATGHVLSASVSGQVARRIDWGLGSSRMTARVRFEMDTLRTVGFRPERRLLGERVSPFCPADRLEGCVAVAPAVYDAETGHVKAVGSVQVESRLVRMRTFSTLGEAVVSEIDPSAYADCRTDRTPAFQSCRKAAFQSAGPRASAPLAGPAAGALRAGVP